jgi:hypothetical protein
MKTTEFLKYNRDEVINFYNNEISGFWTISLSDFMLDLMNNFKKITSGEELKKYDLFGNLQAAKSRLGMFNACEINAIDKKTNYLRNKYNGTSGMALV